MKIDKENNKGFSLIELMVVVAIISFLAIGAATFFSGGIRSWIRGDQQLKAQREARQAMELVVREVRHGQKLSNCSGTTFSVHFPAVLGYDPLVGVTFSWSGTPGDSFFKESSTIIDNVHNLEFKFFNSSGTETNSDEEASRIKILMEIDVSGNERADISLDTDVELRNFGLVTIGEIE